MQRKILAPPSSAKLIRLPVDLESEGFAGDRPATAGDNPEFPRKLAAFRICEERRGVEGGKAWFGKERTSSSHPCNQDLFEFRIDNKGPGKNQEFVLVEICRRRSLYDVIRYLDPLKRQEVAQQAVAGRIRALLWRRKITLCP